VIRLKGIEPEGSQQFSNVVNKISSSEERPRCSSILQFLHHRASICSFETFSLGFFSTSVVTAFVTPAFFASVN
jgi:hypothetical protein